jgi:hypothetical protein
LIESKQKKEKREDAISGRVDVFFPEEDARFFFFFQRKLRRIGRAFEEQKG